MVMLLAQSSSEAAFWEGTLWLSGVVAVTILGLLVIRYLRMRDRQSPQAAEPFSSLAELRGLRDRGDLTVAEYEALKQRVVVALTDSLKTAK